MAQFAECPDASRVWFGALAQGIEESALSLAAQLELRRRCNGFALQMLDDATSDRAIVLGVHVDLHRHKLEGEPLAALEISLLAHRGGALAGQALDENLGIEGGAKRGATACALARIFAGMVDEADGGTGLHADTVCGGNRGPDILAAILIASGNRSSKGIDDDERDFLADLALCRADRIDEDGNCLGVEEINRHRHDGKRQATANVGVRGTVGSDAIADRRRALPRDVDHEPALCLPAAPRYPAGHRKREIEHQKCLTGVRFAENHKKRTCEQKSFDELLLPSNLSKRCEPDKREQR
ncbi:MAG TPA: hypothetical protein VK437_14970 [Steroidobacteraceae bacterium]|nr:hypothetical protein [Steroidobacteraceae bacterium]